MRHLSGVLMRLWRFTDPFDHTFAAAGRLGSWTEAATAGLCPECTASWTVRAKPLILEWETGSDRVGDFTWPAGDVAVADRVLDALQDHFEGFEGGPVEMVQPPGLQPSRSRSPRVWLPYNGPPLHELWVTTWVHMDRDRSSAELERACATCGTERWKLHGIERRDSHFDQKRKELVPTKTDRLPGAGVFIRQVELGGADIFGVRELPAWTFCTDAVRDFIDKKGFTNISFLEMGETY